MDTTQGHLMTGTQVHPMTGTQAHPVRERKEARARKADTTQAHLMIGTQAHLMTGLTTGMAKERVRRGIEEDTEKEKDTTVLADVTAAVDVGMVRARKEAREN